MNRRTFFFGSIATVCAYGCGSGSKPNVFQQIDDFTIKTNDTEEFGGLNFIDKIGNIVWTSSESNGDRFRHFISETANFGRGETNRREYPFPFPGTYDIDNDRYVGINLNGTGIQTRSRDFSLISDIPFLFPEGISSISGKFSLDGNGFLAFTSYPTPVDSGTAYRIDYSGRFLQRYNISKEFYNNPYLIRGFDNNLYLGSSSSEIVNIGFNGTEFAKTGLFSNQQLQFDSKGFAYGTDSKSIFKIDFSTGKKMATYIPPDGYSYFDTAFGSFYVLIDSQDRLYLPVAPEGRRVLVLSTG